MRCRSVSLAVLGLVLIAPAAALAAEAAPDAASDTDAAELVVTAQKLDEARAKVEPSLGASTYTITSALVE
ncbi:MAG TPA: hypothetical protein VFE03_04270, partial [Caulobacteraceae bacterium]|nr:hypothetical protein [Caulobacteraceae bacterium]